MALNPYAANPAADATNENAQRLFRRTGKMPKTTVGGLFGQAFPDPANMAPRNHLSTTGMNIGAQGQVQANLGGLFGMKPPQQQTPQAGPGLFFRPTQYGSDAPTNTPLPAAPPGYSEPLAARSRQMAGIGPSSVRPSAEQLATNHAGFLAHRQEALKARNEGVLFNAQNRADARRSRLGTGETLDMAMRHDPEIAGGIGLARIQGKNAKAALDMQAKASADKNALALTLADKQNAGAETRAKILANSAAIKEGKPVPFADLGGKAAEKSPSQAPDVEELKKLSPEERKLALKDFSQATRDRLMAEANKPSAFQGIVDSPVGSGLGAAFGNPAYALGSLFGAGRTPEPTRPARRGRRLYNTPQDVNRPTRPSPRKPTQSHPQLESIFATPGL